MDIYVKSVVYMDMIVGLHIHDIDNLDVASLVIRSLSDYPIITCVLPPFCIRVSVALQLSCYVLP